MALADYRAEQKRGRQDQGSGDGQLGAIVREARERQGWSQEDWASRSGIHPTTVGKIESGQRGMSLTTFCKLSQSMSNADEWDFPWDVIGYLAGK